MKGAKEAPSPLTSRPRKAIALIQKEGSDNCQSRAKTVQLASNDKTIRELKFPVCREKGDGEGGESWLLETREKRRQGETVKRKR